MNMVAVDLRFLSEMEGKKEECLSSFSIYTAELLDEFKRRKLTDNFVLLVPRHAKKLAQKRFSGFRNICVECAFTVVVKRILKKLGLKSLPFICTIERFCMKCILKWNTVTTRSQIAFVWMPVFTPEHRCIDDYEAVLTVHDLMIWMNNRENADNLSSLKHFKKGILEGKKIVAVSSFTANKVLEEFHISAEKVVAIPEPVSVGTMRMPALNDEIRHAIDKGFILSVNGFGCHKNTITLLKAFRSVSDKIDLSLVCIGAWAEADYFRMLQDYCKEKEIEKRVLFLKGIPNEEKNYFLCHAHLFVTTSLKEGFGRGPVEAAICGIPVISSKSDSLFEATQGLVHYYEDPNDERVLAEIIMDVLNNPDSAEELQAISNELSDCYDVGKCADQFLDIFGIRNVQNY